MAIINLSTEAAQAGLFPSVRFNQRERKMLQSVKAYVDGGSVATHNVVAAGFHTCTAAASQTITVACLPTDVVQVTIKSSTVGTLILYRAAAGTGSIVASLSAPATAGDVLQYCVIRAK
jgi:hypothetical protein